MVPTDPSSDPGDQAPVVCAASNRDGEAGVGSSFDRVIAHLFDCGLGIASVLGDDELDTSAAERLREVSNHLDGVIRDLRTIVLAELRDPQR